MTGFYSLPDAVRFLDEGLARGDDAALAAASREPLPPDRVLGRLRERQRETPLAELYAGREFSAEGDTFKLGVHGRELGHLHIDFIHSGDRWELERISMCR